MVEAASYKELDTVKHRFKHRIKNFGLDFNEPLADCRQRFDRTRGEPRCEEKIDLEQSELGVWGDRRQH